MQSRPDWRSSQRAQPYADNRRWIVMLIVLIGSFGIYLVERALRSPDPLIVGNANIADGDTLTISGVRIRLVNIDAPELTQTCTDAHGQDWPCGRDASNQLRTLVRGRDVSCKPQSRDQYGRTLATCFLPDNTDINGWMVQNGWAVSFDRGHTYSAQQSEAKSARRGIWAGTFIPPREWRREHPRSDGMRKD